MLYAIVLSVCVVLFADMYMVRKRKKKEVIFYSFLWSYRNEFKCLVLHVHYC
jgi:hypothetical protein